jgi:dihydroorotate dehydrogenase (fumarate)
MYCEMMTTTNMTATPQSKLTINNISFKNRIWNASACWSHSAEQVSKLVAAELGAIVGKTCTMEQREGNKGLVYDEWDNERLRWNRMGLPNSGYPHYRDIAITTIQSGTPYILSLYIQNDAVILYETLMILKDYQKTLESVDITSVLVELNVSCPNDKDRIPGYHRRDIAEILGFLDEHLDYYPRIRFGLKLPPYFEKYTLYKIADIIAQYQLVVAYIVCSNTIPNGFHAIKETFGGISGSQVNRMVATGNIHLFRKKLEVAIIGCGGIHTRADIEEYFEAGADAVQLGSGFYNPYANELRVDNIRELFFPQF